MLLIVVIVIFLTLWAVILRWKQRKVIALSKELSSDNVALPFIGHAYLFLGSGEDRMSTLQMIGREAISKGGLTSHWHGSQLYIHVADPVAAEVLLKTCLEKGDLMRLFTIFIGNGSVFAPVPIWRPRRKILAPAFSPKNLNQFIEIFVRQSNIMADQLKSVVGKGAFSMWKYLTTYAMDSVCETTLGIHVNSQVQAEQPFLKAFGNICGIGAKRACQPWLYNIRIFKLIFPTSYRLLINGKKLIWNFMDEYKDSLKTFLDLLIESSGDGKGYNNVELREETLVIVLAGTDTSAVGTAFTTVMLAKHPDVQEKVYQELQEVFGNSDRTLTLEDLPRLKYLEAVVKETLRLYPPVPIITRLVEKDVTLPSGVTLVKGCGLFISIWSIHRNPHYWGEDAEEYRPERFIDTPLKHPAAFIPFSHGPRSCLGYQYAMMSMKTTLATLLRKYRVRPRTDDDSKELRVKFDLMMRDVHDFVVQLDIRT